ncbi:MAG: segregation and condensation protein A [Alphaproteobacteria bacterium]
MSETAGEHGAPTDPDALVVAVDGYSGPLEVLLTLARKQQVDLTRISVLQLVEQYLTFLEDALARRLDLAADYLVTASWLAYLKSRLLLPAPSEPEAEEAQAMAEALTQRLQRLEAIRGAVVELGRRARLGIERLPRGRPEGLKVTRVDGFTTGLSELLGAYAAVARRGQTRTLSFKRPELVPIDVARDGLRAGLVGATDWRVLDDALPAALKTARLARSARASGFAAALELARTAEVELRQEAPFAPLWLRLR